MLTRYRKIRPRRLKKGDTIGIVAPACHFNPDKFREGVKRLKDLGFTVKFDPIIYKKYWGLAGKDQSRARQITRMFADREVKAILCAQAGYGSIRTIPYLDGKTIARNPKIFVGYSDITVLLYYLQRAAKMIVFHGPVVSGEIHDRMNPKTLEYLVKVISQPKPLGEIRARTMKKLRPGKATAQLTGGNLSMIINTIGTPYEINTDNKILFLEDVGEELESIDSFLMHLKLAGKLKKVKGIIFGKMKDCVDFSGAKYSINEVLDDLLVGLDIPVIYGFPSGHRVSGELNITLPLGVAVTINADKRTVIINEPAVA